VVLTDHPQQVHAVAVGEEDVADHGVEAVVAKQLLRAPAVPRRQHVVAFGLE